VEYPDGDVREQVRGQLMGNLLSFPLLCLQNRIAYVWCVRGFPGWYRNPVLINGDDIVFRSTAEVARVWMDRVSTLGLRLCRGKTLVSASVFSLNSTFFRGLRQRVKLLPVLRGAVLARQVEVPHALAPGLSTFCKGFVGEARVRSEVVYLRWREEQFAALGRSVLRDLRVKVSPEALARVGWMRREAFFLECPPCPLPLDAVRLGVPSLPEGWVRVPLARTRAQRRIQRESQAVFHRLLVSRAWLEVPVTRKKLARLTWAGATEGSLRCLWIWHRTRARNWNLLPPFLRVVAKRFRYPLDRVWAYRPKEKVRMVWCGGQPCSPGVGLC